MLLSELFENWTVEEGLYLRGKTTRTTQGARQWGVGWGGDRHTLTSLLSMSPFGQSLTIVRDIEG